MGDGFMSAPKRLSADEIENAERFATGAGIGPLFRCGPFHLGQHGWACPQCRPFLKPARAKGSPRQPWDEGKIESIRHGRS